MKESIPFSDIEKTRCPKCNAGEGLKCLVMAGRGMTRKPKLCPHIERVFCFLRDRDEQAELVARSTPNPDAHLKEPDVRD